MKKSRLTKAIIAALLMTAPIATSILPAQKVSAEYRGFVPKINISNIARYKRIYFTTRDKKYTSEADQKWLEHNVTQDQKIFSKNYTHLDPYNTSDADIKRMSLDYARLMNNFSKQLGLKPTYKVTDGSIQMAKYYRQQYDSNPYNDTTVDDKQNDARDDMLKKFGLQNATISQDMETYTIPRQHPSYVYAGFVEEAVYNSTLNVFTSSDGSDGPDSMVEMLFENKPVDVSVILTTDKENGKESMTLNVFHLPETDAQKSPNFSLKEVTPSSVNYKPTFIQKHKNKKVSHKKINRHRKASRK